MPNKNYQKGVRKERKIVNEAREKGLISFRSAGSHSPIDVTIIDKKNKVIEFIQAKPENLPIRIKEDLEMRQAEVTGSYVVSFRVV